MTGLTFTDCSSLKALLPKAMASAYRDAVLEAVAETGIKAVVFPEACPWSWDEAMAQGFWPE